MSGGPSTRVPSPRKNATKAVRIISGSSYASQDPVSYAPLLFRGGRDLRDLVSRIRLPPERKGNISYFPASLDFHCNAFLGLVVAKPALGRARKRFAIQREQLVAFLQARIACAAFAIHGCNARGGSIIAAD